MTDKHPRRIEFDNTHEYALYDERGLAHDLAETYPDLESAQDDLKFIESETGKTGLTIMMRRVPQDWRPVPKSAV